MKSGKKIIVAILIVLILLLIAGGAFAYVYMETDLLKTDQELFFKYFAQITSEEERFFDKRINEFYEKKKETPYENSGEITVDVEGSEEELETIFKKVNDLIIRFSGKVDSVNQKIEQNIEVDYGNDVIFPVNYRQDGNKLGLQIDELSKQFIAVKNEDLKQFATKFGIEGVSEIPDKIDILEKTESISFTDEEIESLKEIYGTVLEQNLLEENFSSIKTEQSESYTLELNNEQVKNIIIKMLEATKQNTLIIDKINELILEQDSDAEKIEITVIDDLIEGINEEDISDMPNLKIALVQTNKQLSQIIIQSGESNISIEKSRVTDSLSYSINCEIKESAEANESNSMFEEKSEPMQANLYFNMQYVGLDNLENVQENYELGFGIVEEEQTATYNYNVNSNIQFTNSISIQELNEDVAVFLNDYDGEQVITFMTNVGTKLLEINKKQMEKLGIKEYENPLLYSNPLTMYVILNYITYQKASDSIGETVLSQQEIDAFNSTFIMYEGEDVRGSVVNTMISTVLTNNLSSQMENGKTVKITLDGIEISENVDTAKLYVVEAAYDENGYISEMKVTTKN